VPGVKRETFGAATDPLADVASCSYNSTMKTAGIRELKNHLSSYVREVEAGETVLVTDRGRVVAELGPPGRDERALTPYDVRYQRLVAAGALRPATRPRSVRLATLPLYRLSRGTARDLIDEERGE
jgi:antitoxin (DNA-binding transcriptional repressor) of toxin-antitoxin stability system